MTRISMKNLLNPRSTAIRCATFCAVAAFGATLPGISQATSSATPLQPRITAPIDNASRVALAGSRPPRALPANDIGAVPSSLQLQGMSLVFSRTPAQQTALDTLVAAQQNPASPLYHHWITPDQYAAQFGVAPSDIAAAENWLEQQGFSVDSVSRSHNRIFFSGTAGQVASAFAAPLHYYRIPAVGTQPAVTHFAPSADLSLPSALGSVVLAVNNLNDFRPHAHFKLRAPQAQVQSGSRFTSSQTGENFLTPDDLDTIYDISAATGSGYTGTGQTIAVVGQSAFEDADLTDFQTALGIPTKLPTLVLVPDTGTSEINPGGSSDSDEVESDIDLEYSNAIAQGATIDFVYTGNSQNSGGAFQAIQYAVDQKIGDIISSSYGDCEPQLGSGEYATYNASLEQAASQGQSVIAAAGDDGSTDCNGEYSTNDTSANEQLAVDFPGSSQYVTSMGGTEFPVADIAPGSAYFDAQSSSDILSSAKSYIPEEVWNDDAGDVSLGATDPSPIASGGGGVSIFTSHPSWQTGVPGIPSSGNRFVPDLALYSSSSEPDVAANTFYGGYLFCSSDTSFTGVDGSCTHGFRDENDDYLTVAGGTSFAAPIFSGMLAIIDQAKGYTATNGQGLINPTLYTLASDATTYASAFHDITTSGNECAAGTKYCGTGADTTNYYAGTGYDEASGLGSVDLYNLLTAWPTAGSGTGTTGSGTTSFTLTATNVTVAPGASVTGTVTITPASGYTGTVDLTSSYSSLTNGCVVLNPTSVSITGTTPVTSTYTVYTSASACTSAGAVAVGTQTASLSSSAAPHHPNSPWKQLPLPATMAGALLLVCSRRRSRLLRSKLLRAGMALSLLLVLSFSGLGLTGCSSSSTSTSNTGTNTSTTNTPQGSYIITITGTDSKTPTTTGSVTFTVSVS
jgi:subtilase family serine protease